MTDDAVAARQSESRVAGETRSQGSESEVRLATTRDERVRGQWELLRAIDRLDEPAAEALLRWLRIGGYDDNRRLRPLEIWEGISPEIHRVYTHHANRTRIQRILDYVLPGDRLFDVGCGTGYVAGILMRDAGLSYYCGIDVGSHRVRSTRQMIETLGFDPQQVHLETLSVFDLKPEFLKQHRPSLILMLEVLEHLHNPDEALEAVARAAPPDALILFTIPMFGRLDNVKDHYSTFDAERLVELCESVGLVVQHVEPLYNTWTFVLASRTGDVPTERLARLANGQGEPSESGLDQETIATSPALQRREPLFSFEPVSFSKPPDQYRSPWRYRTRSVTVSPAGLRCHVEGSPDCSGGQYGGVQFPVRVLRAILLEMTLVNPENVITVFVDGHNGVGARIVRWEWSLAKSPLAGLRPVSCLLEPGQAATPFTAVGEAIRETVEDIQVFIRVHPNTDAGFVLHRVEAAR